MFYVLLSRGYSIGSIPKETGERRERCATVEKCGRSRGGFGSWAPAHWCSSADGPPNGGLRSRRSAHATQLPLSRRDCRRIQRSLPKTSACHYPHHAQCGVLGIKGGGSHGGKGGGNDVGGGECGGAVRGGEGGGGVGGGEVVLTLLCEHPDYCNTTAPTHTSLCCSHSRVASSM